MRLVFSTGLLLLLVCGNGLIPSAAEITHSAGEDIVIGGHDLKKTVTCKGNNVVVDANDSQLTLKGQCNEVRVNGSTNVITIDVVASIVLESADNTVRWRKAAQGDKPKIVDRSTGNKVEQVK
jgi:hypothetical protein